MVFDALTKLPRKSRSKFLNEPSAGVDTRSTAGRLYRDVVCGLLASHGGAAASTRCQVICRVIARLTVEMKRIETIEASGPIEAMAALSKYTDLAGRMARTLRAFDRLLAAERQTEKRGNDPVRDYLRNKAAAEVAT